MKKKTIIAIILILIATLATWYFKKNSSTSGKPEANLVQNQQQENLPQKEEKVLPASVNGLAVESSIAQKRPLAVIVENHPDARPQSGLLGADMVYETLAEGGITRFMAIYQTQNVASIGPVRSARTYFAEIADELGAVFAHVGGNSDALENIKKNLYPRISDADQFFDDGSYFSRITSRPMPHNVYTSIDKLENLAAAKKFNAIASYAPWQFRKPGDSISSSTPAQNILIDFSLSQFAVNYKYDSQSQKYLRYMAGKSHLEGSQQIAADTIIIQQVETFPVKSDTPLAIGMTLIGSGKAYVFAEGKMTAGTWKKEEGGRTRYFGPDGQEIKLKAGKIWVEIVPVDRNVSWR